jgi:CHAP domain
MNVSEALARATSMIGKGTKYGLGKGGNNPDAPTPADKNGYCDCSGFICWCLRLKRQTTHPAYPSGWINTSSIVADANSAVGFFSRLQTPTPGALWVYGWRQKRAGHVAIIETVSKTGCTIIHCRSTKGDAIARTSGALFEKNPAAIIAWYAGFDSAATLPAHELLDELYFEA